ncbi:nucleotidyltransferase domain-containing protein [soil metagenome]|jgi:predicted nucleotidyltransferase
MAPGEDAAIEELIRRLVEALGPERIYLFGSRARGEARPDSDYDLMVVVRGSDLPGYRRDQLAYGALRGMEVAKDVLVWTSDEFDRRRHLVASLPATILREGRLIYGG